MIRIPPLIHYLLTIGLAIYVGGWLHELSHWFVGWLGKTDPTIQRTFLIFPNGVDHSQIETMDGGLIRLSGVAVFLWIPPGFIAIGYTVSHLAPATVFVAVIPIVIQAMATESDAIAVRDPEEFRQKWIEDDFSRNPLFLPNWLFPDWLPRF